MLLRRLDGGADLSAHEDTQDTPRKLRDSKTRQSPLGGSCCGRTLFPVLIGTMALGAFAAVRIGSTSKLSSPPASGAGSGARAMGTLELIGSGLGEVGSGLLAPVRLQQPIHQSHMARVYQICVLCAAS